MAEAKVQITPEEFYRMAQQTEDRVELVNGEVLHMMLPGARHGFVVHRVARVLGELVPAEDAEVFDNIGILLPSGNVRGPDVCLISKEKIRRHGIPVGWWDDTIELAIEVIGAEERHADLDRKIEEYFAAAVRQVWKVNPDTRKVALYRSPTEVTIFAEGDELIATDLHPMLRFPVRRLFE